MKRKLCVLVAMAWPLASQADLTLTGFSMVGAFGMPSSSQEKIWIQNGLVRRDFVDRGRSYSYLFDLDKHQAVAVDHLLHMAENHDLTALKAKTEISAPASGLKLDFEATGRTRPLNSWKCQEHNLSATMPARLGNEETVFHLNGQVWIASGVPEQAAIKSFNKLADKQDFFLTIPGIANTSPAQARALSEVIRKLAAKGLPCGGELTASFEGNGPMANLAKKMPAKFAITFQDFSTEAIKPETFVVPAGYRVYQRPAGGMP